MVGVTSTVVKESAEELIPFFFIGVTTNAGLASIRAWMSVMDLEIWYN
ncbi:hypothetical protein H0901_09435 [Microcystis aeruginosa BLCCF158]|uniref:Uncharacterized protein n=1 Tax=Microcystis aeruginosa BLCC-F158 TaxID=2755316 RepID=A0A841UY87_MICAE|nr:hypothetical protein [Microcystis aeruginosa]MBC1195482.1 hypothetical protein [Microcystis aeruginosa BLCC-F158]